MAHTDSLRRPLPQLIPRLVAAFLAAFLIGSATAQGETGAWAQVEHARLRLLSAGPNPDGTMAAAIEIELDDGWKTYWRSPGDAGLAPLFDFAGSTNVLSAEVRFPPPERWNDGFTISNVYEHRVVLPVAIRLANPASPTRLEISAQIGVCETICILAEFSAEVTVPPGFTDGRAARAINDAVALLPGPPTAGTFEVESVDQVDGTEDEPVFEIALTVPAEGVEIFVEGPSDWYASEPVVTEASRNRAVYRVGFDRLGSTVAIPGARLTVTAIIGGTAIEQTVEIQ